MAESRRTSQRQYVLFAVKTGKGFLSAQEVLTVVRKRIPKVSAATVYRNLAALCRSGELSSIEGEDGRRRYLGHAHHEALFSCQRCKKVRTVRSRTLNDYVQRKMFKPQTVLISRLTASGLCSICTKELGRA